jgi:adenosylhomocysteine nucleosidase
MLGIIGAMDEEVAMIKAQLTDVQVETRAAMDFYKGKLEGKEVVVVRSGIGKVNAAMCTQILADIYGVTGVVNTGIAGSLKAEIDIGDIVLSSDAVQHDMDATGFGYEPGQIPRVETLAFKADEGLIHLAEECCSKVNPDIHTFVGRVETSSFLIREKRSG